MEGRGGRLVYLLLILFFAFVSALVWCSASSFVFWPFLISSSLYHFFAEFFLSFSPPSSPPPSPPPLPPPLPLPLPLPPPLNFDCWKKYCDEGPGIKKLHIAYMVILDIELYSVSVSVTSQNNLLLANLVLIIFQSCKTVVHNTWSSICAGQYLVII